jgi:hypothetical protein
VNAQAVVLLLLLGIGLGVSAMRDRAAWRAHRDARTVHLAARPATGSRRLARRAQDWSDPDDDLCTDKPHRRWR